MIRKWAFREVGRDVSRPRGRWGAYVVVCVCTFGSAYKCVLKCGTRLGSMIFRATFRWIIELIEQRHCAPPFFGSAESGR